MSLMEELEELGGFTNNSHVVYASGKHGRAFVNFVALIDDPRVFWIAARQMADLVMPLQFDVLVGPTHTGDKIASAVGIALSMKGRTVKTVYAQEKTHKVDEKTVVIPGRDFPREQSSYIHERLVVITDDVLTTGSTIDEVLEAVKEADGWPVAILVGCNRSEHKDRYRGLPIISLLSADLDQWTEDDCLPCIEQIPVNTTVNSHGKQWLENHPDPSLWPAYVKVKAT